MPRLQLWDPKKKNDYTFFDQTISDLVKVGGTAFLIHKYIGPHEQDPTDDLTQPNVSNPIETTIQDLLLLENRDRNYDPDLYELMGMYQVQDNDFNLAQFGLFLTNDTLFVEFHLNDMIASLGRKLMSGDVIEVPHLIDDTLLRENADEETGPVIPKLFKIEDANRSAGGFSQSWWPHLWRIKISPITDSQEFRDILGDGDNEDDLKNFISTFNDEIFISDSIIAEAERQVPNRNTEHAHLYVSDDNDNGLPYLVMTDGEPPNGATLLGSGTSFPVSPAESDWFLRTDYEPNLLFQRTGLKWIRKEADFKKKWTTANRLLNAFINNTNIVPTSQGSIPSKAGISKALATKVRPDVE